MSIAYSGHANVSGFGGSRFISPPTNGSGMVDPCYCRWFERLHAGHARESKGVSAASQSKAGARISARQNRRVAIARDRRLPRFGHRSFPGHGHRGIECGRPLGDEAWVESIAGRLKLESTMRPRVRPGVRFPDHKTDKDS